MTTEPSGAVSAGALAEPITTATVSSPPEKIRATPMARTATTAMRIWPGFTSGVTLPLRRRASTARNVPDGRIRRLRRD